MKHRQQTLISPELDLLRLYPMASKADVRLDRAVAQGNYHRAKRCARLINAVEKKMIALSSVQPYSEGE